MLYLTLPSDNLDIIVLTRANKILFKQGPNSQNPKNSIQAIGVETENLGTFEKINFSARKEIIMIHQNY